MHGTGGAERLLLPLSPALLEPTGADVAVWTGIVLASRNVVGQTAMDFGGQTITSGSSGTCACGTAREWTTREVEATSWTSHDP